MILSVRRRCRPRLPVLFCSSRHARDYPLACSIHPVAFAWCSGLNAARLPEIILFLTFLWSLTVAVSRMWKNAGASISTLCLSRLCDLALDQVNEKDEGDARAQSWKPQNPLELEIIIMESQIDANAIKPLGSKKRKARPLAGAAHPHEPTGGRLPLTRPLNKCLRF